MINQLKIKNFKSIVDLTLPLGRVNILIGSNGCGKSNILEAISFGSAAAQDRLDYEYLINRDVRMSDPEFMVNAFDEEEDSNSLKKDPKLSEIIQIEVIDDEHPCLCKIIYNESAKRWVNYSKVLSESLKYLRDETGSNEYQKKKLY